MIATGARRAHPIACAIFAACATLQVFLAGLGVFDDPRAFVTHREFGYLFGWLTLVVLILALVGKVARRIAAMSALLLVLFAFQSVLVALRVELPAVAALHPLNGFAILGLAVLTARASWVAGREPAAAHATARRIGALGDA